MSFHVCFVFLFVFFFKQKTAYEMRISDWSSDVCSSDLHAVLAGMSQGGYLSLRCALRHPQCVRALILIDTQAQTEDAAKTEGYKQMLEAWAQHGLPQQIADTVAQIGRAHV